MNEWNVRWNILISGIVMRLRSVIFNMCKLHKVLDREIMCTEQIIF